MYTLTKLLFFASAVVCIQIFAEEDPSYEPRERFKSPPAPKRSVTVTEPTPAPTRPAPVRSEPVYTPAPVAAPAGPKVKYILNGKPIYEGDPDPVAESNARNAAPRTRAAASLDDLASPPVVQPPPPAPRPAPVHVNVEAIMKSNTNDRVRLDSSTMAPPIRPRTTDAALSVHIDTPPPVYAAPAPSAPAGRTVKYILDGKPVYEGDHDPVAATKAAELNAAPTAAPNIYTPPPANPAGLLDDVTADRPQAPGAGLQPAAVPGQLVLEDMPPSGQLNSKAQKCYEILALLKKDVESVSRFMENRGRENARLIHTSELLLNHINDLAAIWPTSDAFIDVCSTTKRAALLFNSEVSNDPWTWTRVRWSYESMVREVKLLRPYAKAQADAEPRPQAIVTKEGQVVYQDAQPNVDPLVARREAAAQAARDELARYKANAAAREERAKNKSMPIDLDKK